MIVGNCAEIVKAPDRPAPQQLVGAWCEGAVVGHTGGVLALALSQDGRVAISGGRDGALRRWQSASGRCLGTLEGHADAVTAVCLSGDGRCVLSGSVDGTLRWWDLARRQCVRVLSVRGQGPVTDAILVPGSALAVSREADGRVRFWDVETGKCVNAFPGLWRQVSGWLAGRPDRATLARLARDGYCAPLALAGNGRLLLARSDRSWLELYAPGGRLLSRLTARPGRPRALAMTRDGSHAVVSDPNGLLRLCDLALGKCVRCLAGHTDEVSALATSPDGRYAVSGGWDRTVRVWDLATGNCLATLRGHRDWLQAVCVAPDLGFVLSAGLDGTIRRWGLDWAEAIE